MGYTPSFEINSDSGTLQSIPKKKWIIPTVVVVSVVVILSTGIIASVLIFRVARTRVYTVATSNMSPVLVQGDKVSVNTHAYKKTKPKRGDIIVLEAPSSIKRDSSNITSIISRVIGVSGETIEGKCSGEPPCRVQIYINNKKINESYLSKNIQYEPFPEIQIPQNSVFVMGDNRSDSADSRFYGPIQDNTIAGKIIRKIN